MLIDFGYLSVLAFSIFMIVITILTWRNTETIKNNKESFGDDSQQPAVLGENAAPYCEPGQTAPPNTWPGVPGFCYPRDWVVDSAYPTFISPPCGPGNWTCGNWAGCCCSNTNWSRMTNADGPLLLDEGMCNCESGDPCMPGVPPPPASSGMTAWN